LARRRRRVEGPGAGCVRNRSSRLAFRQKASDGLRVIAGCPIMVARFWREGGSVCRPNENVALEKAMPAGGLSSLKGLFSLIHSLPRTSSWANGGATPPAFGCRQVWFRCTGTAEDYRGRELPWSEPIGDS
jgi:hypothetical protein